jgi:hypothetical protein
MFQEMITQHADTQRPGQQTAAQHKTPRHAPVKHLAGQQRACAMLEHGDMLFPGRNYSS